MSVTKTHYAFMPDGTEVHLFTITNNNEISAGIITKGATLNSFTCPDKDGNMGDIIMGFDTIDKLINLQRQPLRCLCFYIVYWRNKESVQ